MTGQDLLNYMELVNAELQLQSGEADVTRGLLALNVAQDLFENLAAQVPNIFGSSTGTVLTSSGVETTAWPTGLLRLDALDYIDPATSRPAWRILPATHAPNLAQTYLEWVMLSAVSISGKPSVYWTNGTSFYWSPLPDGNYTVRYYGLSSAADVTASGTFAYPDAAAFPLAGLAAKILKMGVDDDSQELSQVAQDTMASVIKTLGSFNRDGAKPLIYSRAHEA